MARQILVTGGTGFLGRKIVYFAREAGMEVHTPRHYECNLETGEGIDAYMGDLRNREVELACIIHSAAYYGGAGLNKEDPAGLITRNTRMTASVFEMAIQYGVRKVISVGSSCEYPGHLQDLLRESEVFNGRCHETVDAYGMSKRLHLVFQAAYHRQHNLEAGQVILPNLFGEFDAFQERRSHAVAALIRKVAEAHATGGSVQAWGTGTPTRDFLYVDDAAKAIVAAVDFPHDLEPVNIPGAECSIAELTYLLADIVGLPRERIVWDTSKPDGVARKSLSPEKLKRLFPDYAPMPLQDALRKTVTWYLANKAEADRRP